MTTPGGTDDQLDPSSGLVVVDPRGELFSRVRRLDLGVAIWRTLQMPGAGQAPEPGTLVVLAEYGPPDWGRIQSYRRHFATVVAVERATSAQAVAALEAGAVGLLDLEMPDAVMRRALQGALRGEPIYSREILGTWLRGIRGSIRGSIAGVEGLTARQREIVALIARGSTDKEIAVILGIRTATAQKHVANVLRRLGVPNRAAAVGMLMKSRANAAG